MKKRFLLVLFPALLAMTCSAQPDSYVVVRADVNCDVPPVFQLRITITNDTASDQKFVPDSNSVEMGFPSSFALILPGSRSGYVDLAIDALDKNHRVIGQGSTNGTIKVGSRLDLQVQLTTPPVVCGDGIIETGESCDDGNRVSGDGCSSTCQTETPAPLDDGGIGEGKLGADSGKGGSTGAPYLFVAVGDEQSCAVRNDSSVWCWGSNAYGQLRLSGTTSRLTPANAGGTGWNRVTCGQTHTCALTTGGGLSCWGNNESGQLGNASVAGTGQTEVPGNSWQGASAGEYQTCAVKTDSSLWCWGDNTNGQLGNGNTLGTKAPTQVAGTGWAQVSSNYQHTCAVKSDGSLWCWGLNANLQLGDPTAAFSMTPIQVDGSDWISVTTGLYSTCAIKKDQTLWCWGGNISGQLGTLTVAVGPDSKTNVAGQVASTHWTSVSAGRSHVCAIAADSLLWCWGDNSSGQVGNQDVVSAETPTQVVVSGRTWAMVAAGTAHTCAVAVDGTLWCWGENTSGQLGIGTSESQKVPTQVAN